VIVNVAAMKAVVSSWLLLQKLTLKRHDCTYIAVKSDYYATNYEHIHVGMQPVITLNPIRFLRPYHYQLIEIIHRPVLDVHSRADNITCKSRLTASRLAL